MIHIRLGKHHKIKENALALISEIRKNKGCCDEVWFSSEYGYPSLEKHKAAAEQIAQLSELFKSEGIRVSLQISNTIGHGEYISYSNDCSGLVYEGSNVEKLVDANGTVADYAFCWRGDNFKKYTTDALKYYAAIKPHTFWIDDDLRAYNHAPVEHGCFCKNCLEAFNKQYNHTYDREELYKEICYGDTDVREEYISFIREGLYDFTALITKTLIDISPDSYMGFQSCRCNNYTGLDQKYIFEPMLKFSGKAPKYRPGGGFYNDKTPLDMLEKARMIESAVAQSPDYVADKVCEVENTPDVAFGKSIWGTVKEATLHMAFGCTSASFASLMTPYEDVSWHSNMLKAFSQVKPYWKELSRVSSESKTCGVSVYESNNSYKMKLRDTDSPFRWSRIYYMHGNDLLKIGVPVTNFSQNAKAYIITSDMLDYMDNAEIETLKNLPVITDAQTVEKILERGVDMKIDVIKLKKDSYKEVLNSENDKIWVESFFTSKGLPTYVIKGENIKPIGTLYNNITNELIGCCNAIISNDYSKWAVFGYCLWNDIVSTDKRNQILHAVDEISDNTLPAMLQSAEQVIVIPKVNNSGKTVAVSLQNISIGKTEELTVIVRNPVSEEFYYMNASTPKTKIKAEKVDNDYIIKLPSINGWEMITLFAK